MKTIGKCRLWNIHHNPSAASQWLRQSLSQSVSHSVCQLVSQLLSPYISLWDLQFALLIAQPGKCRKMFNRFLINLFPFTSPWFSFFLFCNIFAWATLTFSHPSQFDFCLLFRIFLFLTYLFMLWRCTLAALSAFLASFASFFLAFFLVFCLFIAFFWRCCRHVSACFDGVAS